ncbi:MFS transporter [Acidobacteria bacterium AH-259-G07]|nr:MFS transporter [Acidobacteria bacterium AH-259-G07]
MKIQDVTPFSREIWGWALYDFANSAYSTALAGVIFSVYFVQDVVGDQGLTLFGSRMTGPAVWGYSVSLSMLLVAVIAPVLGAVADYRASKKRFLFYFCYGGVLATAFLFLARPGEIWLAVIFYILSNMGLESSMAFYNGFLPEIASREHMGRISGFGWALGYVGGVSCLVLNLAMIERPNWFGLPATDYIPVRASLVVVAAWWGLFSIPTFLWLRERARAQELPPGAGYLRVGFQRLTLTFRKINQFRELVKFLVAFLIYNDGVQTVIVMAAVFGADVLGMSQQELIPCFILTNSVAFVGALLFGYLGDRMSTKSAIHITLFIWSVAVLYVVVINEIWQFWLLAVIIGSVLGGIQASSRALLAQFTPPENSAEFFGFFATSGKFASIFGPAFFAMVTDLTGTARWGVVSVLIFFIIGWAILSTVDEKKGIAQAQYAVK